MRAILAAALVGVIVGLLLVEAWDRQCGLPENTDVTDAREVVRKSAK